MILNYYFYWRRYNEEDYDIFIIVKPIREESAFERTIRFNNVKLLFIGRSNYSIKGAQ